MDVQKCSIEATVPTGFEPTAREEAEEKLGVTATYERGKICFDISLDDMAKVKQLQSVDNVFVVMNTFKNVGFENNLVEALLLTMDLVPKINWKLGLNVWCRYTGSSVKVSSDPVPDWPERIERAKQKLRVQYSADKPVVTDKTEKHSKDADNSEAGKQDIKRARLEHDPTMPAFRATCYRTGKGHVFQSPQAAAAFGGAVQDYFLWNVKMKDFDIEVVLSIEERDVTVMIALTKESLHRRHITKFGPTTLRPTIAYGMLRLCKINDDDVVCDPMCGGGSIPIEAAINWPKARHLCGDYDERAVNRTQENLLAVNNHREEKQLCPLSVGVLRWDATELPLKDNYVDVLVSDMPFGKRSGSKMRNWHLYPKTLSDLARVGKLGTGRACLLTQDKKCMLKSLSSVRRYWCLLNTVYINIGGLAAGVYILKRTQEVFKSSSAEPQSNSTEQSAQNCDNVNSIVNE